MADMSLCYKQNAIESIGLPIVASQIEHTYPARHLINLAANVLNCSPADVVFFPIIDKACKMANVDFNSAFLYLNREATDGYLETNHYTRHDLYLQVTLLSMRDNGTARLIVPYPQMVQTNIQKAKA